MTWSDIELLIKMNIQHLINLWYILNLVWQLCELFQAKKLMLTPNSP